MQGRLRLKGERQEMFSKINLKAQLFEGDLFCDKHINYNSKVHRLVCVCVCVCVCVSAELCICPSAFGGLMGLIRPLDPPTRQEKSNWSVPSHTLSHSHTHTHTHTRTLSHPQTHAHTHFHTHPTHSPHTLTHTHTDSTHWGHGGWMKMNWSISCIFYNNRL